MIEHLKHIGSKAVATKTMNQSLFSYRINCKKFMQLIVRLFWLAAIHVKMFE